MSNTTDLEKCFKAELASKTQPCHQTGYGKEMSRMINVQRIRNMYTQSNTNISGEINKVECSASFEGWGRDYSGEQRRSGSWEKSDEQWRRCPSENAAHQHTRAVLGKRKDKLQRSQCSFCSLQHIHQYDRTVTFYWTQLHMGFFVDFKTSHTYLNTFQSFGLLSVLEYFPS